MTTFSHSDYKCKGTALRLNLHPAHSFCEGFVVAELAAQSSIESSNQNGETIEATFDWSNAFVRKIERDDLAEICRVIRGERHDLDYANDIFCGHRDAFQFTHILDPKPGFILRIRHTEDNHVSYLEITLTTTEAYALLRAFDYALARVMFAE